MNNRFMTWHSGLARLLVAAGRGGNKKGPFLSQPSWFLPLPDAREPEVSVSISVGEDGSSSRSSDMSGSSVSDEEEALDLEDESSRGEGEQADEEDSGIRWGRPYFVSPESAPSVEILLLGRDKSRRRGGSHIVLLVEPRA